MRDIHQHAHGLHGFNKFNASFLQTMILLVPLRIEGKITFLAGMVGACQLILIIPGQRHHTGAGVIEGLQMVKRSHAAAALLDRKKCRDLASLQIAAYLGAGPCLCHQIRIGRQLLLEGLHKAGYGVPGIQIFRRFGIGMGRSFRERRSLFRCERGIGITAGIGARLAWIFDKVGAAVKIHVKCEVLAKAVTLLELFQINHQIILAKRCILSAQM